MAMLRVLLPYRNPKKVAPYERAAEAARLEPVAVPASGKLSLSGYAGLLLLGGTDVNPTRYGQQPSNETDSPDDERDAVELVLIDEALGKDLPILAICRGLQILNVYHGGTLKQHLASPRHDPENEDAGAPAHEVSIAPGTRLAQVAQNGHWLVNSRHHQAADRIGDGLRVSAQDPEDQIIEGLERPDRKFVIAVQWHPEDQVFRDREQLRLFEQFAVTCGEHANSA